MPNVLIVSATTANFIYKIEIVQKNVQIFKRMNGSNDAMLYKNYCSQNYLEILFHIVNILVKTGI